MVRQGLISEQRVISMHDFQVAHHIRMDRLALLASIAEPESWGIQFYILRRYIDHVFQRLVEESKVLAIRSPKDQQQYQMLCFNTGLLTPRVEEIYCLLKVTSSNSNEPPINYDSDNETVDSTNAALLASQKARKHQMQQMMADMDPEDYIVDEEEHEPPVRSNKDSHASTNLREPFLLNSKFRWKIVGFKTSADLRSREFMKRFDSVPVSEKPLSPSFFDDSSQLYFDPRIRVHLSIAAQMAQFLQFSKYNYLSQEDMEQRVKTGVELACMRACKYPRLAVPQFWRDRAHGYRGEIQLLLPINFNHENPMLRPEACVAIALQANPEPKSNDDRFIYEVRSLVTRKDGTPNARLIQPIDQRWLSLDEFGDNNLGKFSRGRPPFYRSRSYFTYGRGGGTALPPPVSAAATTSNGEKGFYPTRNGHFGFGKPGKPMNGHRHEDEDYL